MGMHEPNTAKVVALQSDAYQRSKIAFLRSDNTIDAIEQSALDAQLAALSLAQQMDDDLAEGIALIRYGTTLPYHAKRRRQHLALIESLTDEPQTAA